MSSKDGSKVEEMVGRAKSIIISPSNVELGKMELWRAYVAIEYAILDLKLRRGIEGQTPPARLPTRKKKAAQKVDLAMARQMVERINLESDEKKLLYDLRACRDVLKSLVAGYGRRSMMS